MADAVPVVWRGGAVPDGDDDQAPAAGQLLTPSKYRTVVSMLSINRTGHARFRRAPVVQETAPASPVAEEAARDPSMAPRDLMTRRDGLGASAASSSFPSSVTAVTATGEGSVSNGRALLPAAGGHSSGGGGKLTRSPPMQFASHHHSSGLNHNSDGDGGERCRCSNKRKKSSSSRARRRIRVPAISSRNADIPPDDYSWRKYGQKPIKGSPYPRGYYKCSTGRGCPARKHVERDPGEPSMLIVTYDSDHRHGDDDPVVPGAVVPEI
ncbi:hypothetical protein GUJ93_ZPchr0006g45648 [Zizania palustris]|uniref:WRKY transcription factor WRKY51 n=1 Tax=Zizania palustris TaxID=103762 RepID=A0A8J5VKK5_ZIZPA|nr:hypothetical protein GUJ93_ZPchr0006g45648 [Zizania palustris]